MGTGEGTYTEDELKHLTPDKREELKREARHQLLTSEEIRAIINNNPELLTKDPAINNIMRKNLDHLVKK
jgi:hypothetical protein